MEPEGPGHSNHSQSTHDQQSSAAFRARQNSVRFSIIPESSAKPPTGGARGQTILGSSRKEVPAKARIIKEKPSTDSTTMDRIINEIVQSLAALNAFKEPYGKKMFKNVGSKDFWLSVVHRLLEIYEGGPVTLPPTNEGIISLIKGLGRQRMTSGYPYQLKADVLGVIGAPHSWNQALFVLHWLAQVVETGVDPKLGHPRQSESPELLKEIGTEENIFDFVSNAISTKVGFEEAGRSIGAEEARLRNQLNFINSEVTRLSHEHQITQSNQPAVDDLQKEVHSLVQNKEQIRRKQDAVRLEELKIKKETELEQTRYDQKTEVIKALQNKLLELEEKVSTQAIDVGTARLFVQENTQNQQRISKLSEEVNKLRISGATAEKTIQAEAAACQKLCQEFGERLLSIQSIAPVDVSIQSPSEEYRRAVIELQAATESRLSQNRHKIEEIHKQQIAKQMELSALQAEEQELKERVERLHNASKKIRDQKIHLEREKTSKEKDLESKKLQLNNEVLGLSNQLDRLLKDLQQLEFEQQTAARELEQAKGLVLQAVEQNRLMLLALKKQHIEKLGVEEQRTGNIKSGLTQYLLQRKR